MKVSGETGCKLVMLTLLVERATSAWDEGLGSQASVRSSGMSWFRALFGSRLEL